MKREESSGPSSSKVKAPRLERPVRITEQVWSEKTVPVVSVFCVTYNHAQFIRDTIEGFLMQETTFPVEIFVHDDASSDSTDDIVREYQAKYPNLFSTVFQTKNQYSASGYKFFFEYLSRQRGEFIALCEGDDYWTCSTKLEKQVHLLESSETSSGCFHLAIVTDENGVFRDTSPPQEYRRDREFEDLAFNYWLPTCSLMYRSAMAPNDMRWADSLEMGDVPLLAELTARGPLLFVDEALAVYRQHSGGMWTRATLEQKFIAMIGLYNRAQKRFGARRLVGAQKARKSYYAQLFGVLVERAAFSEAWCCLARYLTAAPLLGGPLLKTQKSNMLRLCTFGTLPRQTR
jgi:glycosyltransferase involved in cell wall biosynthesis